MKKAMLGGLALTAVFAFSTTIAFAEYRGTDMWSNITPGGGAGGLVDRYPLSHYQLDYNVDFSFTSPGGAIPSLMQFTASWIFFLSAVVMRFVIYIFDWAFHADLLTGDNGLLAPLTEIVKTNYTQIIVPFLVPFIICFGAWAAYKAISKQHKDVGSVFSRTFLFFVLSFAIAFHPNETIGAAYRMISGLSSAVVSQGGDERTVSDSLFATFIQRPWAVLQFGGMEVCTGSKIDSDGFPLAATDANPSKVCHSVMSKDKDGHGDYARYFLTYDHGSTERDMAYEAVKNGDEGASAPTNPGPGRPPVKDKPQFSSAFPGWKIDKTDAPAVDMMQAGGSLQRLVYAVFIAIGMLGGILLVGMLAIAALFAEMAIALLFVASSFMVLAAVLPATHVVVERWLKLLGKMLIAGLVYALLLMAVLNTSRALLLLGGDQGYLIVFFLQAALYLGVFFKRKTIIEKLTSSKAAERYMHSENQVTSFVAGAATGAVGAISEGAGEFAQSMRNGWSDHSEGGDSSSSQRPENLPETSDEDQVRRWNDGTQQVPQSQNGSAHPEPAPQAQNGGDPMPTTSFREDLEQARQAQSSPEQPSTPQPQTVEGQREKEFSVDQSELRESFDSVQPEPQEDSYEQVADTPHTGGQFASSESFAEAIDNAHAQDREYYER